MAVIVEKFRAQCRIDTDDAIDDELLTLYFRVACRKAEDFTSHKLYEEVVPEGDPEGVLIADNVLLALMLLVGHWYESRENSSDVNKAPVPLGFPSLLGPYRSISLQEETYRRVDYVIA